MPGILFVAGQSAASSFLAPLWRRWLAAQDRVDFRVCLHPSAALAVSDLASLPVVDSVDDNVERALGGWRPDLVVTSLSGKGAERAAFDVARQHGIPVWQFIDTWYDYAVRIANTNGPSRLPDRLLVIDELARQEAIGEGISDDIIAVVGNPAWEKITPSPAADERAVMFVSQPIAQHWGESLGYTESAGWQMVCAAACAHPDLFPRLIFAPHPDEQIPAAVRESKAEIVESGRAGIAVAGHVLGLYSSVMVDALLCGRKVISVQPGAGIADKCSLSRHGFIPRARNVAELVQMMHEPPRSADGVRAAVASSCGRLERALLTEMRACVSLG